MTLKVLVVDDSALMRKALKNMLLASGDDVQVETARDGQDALDAIARIEPDVVTLDINMPVMDGLTCLSRIMESNPLPVIMVSSLTEKGALATLEALELGAVDYLAKPGGTVSLNLADVETELVTKVSRAAQARVRSSGLTSRLRRQREGALAGERPAPPAPAGPAGPAGADLVLIGSSTGGPALLSRLLPELPSNFGAPVVVAQHMPGTFTGALAKRLDGICALGVEEVRTATVLRPGRIYIAQGDADVVISRRSNGLSVRPVPASAAHRWHPSVDRLVQSAAEAADPARMVGVLLTGMGDDGAATMADLRTRGGRTVAESEESAIVWGMPGQLVARGGATRVLAADGIMAQVRAWV